tara:strand:+ start:1748 stop:3040 length:1293 start_codon:yes stop_codon:yes gene_type:complete
MRTLIEDAWLLGASLLIGIGLLASSSVVIVLGTLVFLSSAAGRIWAKISLDEVYYTRDMSLTRMFVGEETVLTLALANRKLLPVPWIEVREQVPEGLLLIDEKIFVTGASRTRTLRRNTALGRRDRVEWRVTVRAVTRGYYRIGPTTLFSGDIFGFFENEMVADIPAAAIIVYPHTYLLPELGFDSVRPFGELPGGNRIYEDPSRIVGVRDYQSSDPMKRIDWNATARVQRLQSRLYEPSRAQSIVIAFNVGTLKRSWEGSDPIVLERGVSVAASIARWAYDTDLEVGLIANGAFPGQGRPIHLGVGRHPDRLNRLLEALAGISSFTISSLARELEGSLTAGSTVIVVAAVMPDDLVATLHRLRRDGHHIHVVKISSQIWESELGSIPVSDIANLMESLEAGLAEELGVPGETILTKGNKVSASEVAAPL